MVKMGQKHRVRTGFEFCKILRDDGVVKWEVYSPMGAYVMACDNYIDAYRLATNLKEVTT